VFITQLLRFFIFTETVLKLQTTTDQGSSQKVFWDKYLSIYF